MRRAIVVIALALTMLVAAACPVIAAVAQPSPTERVDRVDFNGDGFDDLAIGVPGEGIGGAALAGAVNILYGGAGGLAGTNQLLTQGNPEPVDLFGFTVAKGDFNADGFTDLAVGAPSEDVGTAGLAGAVNVFYGSANGLPATSQVRLQSNPENSDRFGSALDAGLFNDDDVMDLAVGAPGETVGGRPDAGAVSVFYGSAGGCRPPARPCCRETRSWVTASERRWWRGSSTPTRATWPLVLPVRMSAAPAAPGR